MLDTLELRERLKEFSRLSAGPTGEMEVIKEKKVRGRRPGSVKEKGEEESRVGGNFGSRGVLDVKTVQDRRNK